MKKKILNENEQKIITEIKDTEFREKLSDGFKNGSFMTTEEFCQKLETLKISLINKYKDMEKIKNFNEFVNSKTLNEKTPTKEWDDMLLEMAQIGNINKTLVIYVRSNDPGNIPHFHIVDKTTLGNKFHTCIKIETSEYFHHTGKEDVLNSKERKQLLDFLNYSNELGVSNWRYLLLSWNTNNSTKKVNMNIQMPDYTNIK